MAQLTQQTLRFASTGTRSIREKLGLAKTSEETTKGLTDFVNNHPELAYEYTIDPELKTTLSPSERLQAMNLDNPQTAEGWRITRNRLLDMAARTKAAGASFLLVLIPAKEQVYLEYMQRQGQGTPATFTEFVAKAGHLIQTVQSFCRNENLNCLSVLPDMVQAMQAGTMLYGPNLNSHPVRNGYRVIAEGISTYAKSAHFGFSRPK
jgi:hypothetical protein